VLARTPVKAVVMFAAVVFAALAGLGGCTALSPGATAPFLSGTLAGTTMSASWTAVSGATSYTLTRLVTALGTDALFQYPYGVAVASDGTVYVADTSNNRIRKVTAAGVVTTLAGSTGARRRALPWKSAWR